MYVECECRCMLNVSRCMLNVSRCMLKVRVGVC